ncbi:hypothetical protein LTR56_006337 [Elasticomyces elasticus]|nr:hypothetical protein LTR56_006337 [Elasticomyces elasticus]KAK3663385.1 hypothetical protein LTR22_005792 [Elasticomyces elasticus]KAK4925464.1 hypothetical protein LTR49_007528 [Elasticomyces elasticus]
MPGFIARLTQHIANKCATIRAWIQAKVARERRTNEELKAKVQRDGNKRYAARIRKYGAPLAKDQRVQVGTTTQHIKHNPVVQDWLGRFPSMAQRRASHEEEEDHASPSRLGLRKRRMRRYQSPDRFVPSRDATPTKEALLSTHTPSKSAHPDPFAPPTRRTFRMAEQYATLQSPSPAPRAVGRTGTLVTDSPDVERRAVSEGAVWTVGGALVTEGVPSTTNGRGGRVTSGTSAPHYAADFLRKTSAGDDEKTHSRRLALALEMKTDARMLEYNPTMSTSSGSPSSSGSPRTSRTPTTPDRNPATLEPSPTKKPKPKKVKDIPVIPFRVLDAPALRDDYYCSLLAYSPTVHCLAVGLGPHVYLWSESKAAGIQHLPDSLTAPLAAHVTSLSFSSTEGGSAILAIGRADGKITLWSPLDRDPRFDSEQPAPVSCVCFRPKTAKSASIRDPCVSVQTEELLVGDEAGNVYLYAVEWPNQDQRDLFDWHGSMTLLARISCHTQQVCGMAWSPDGDVFATGGNDNQLYFSVAAMIATRRRTRDSSDDTVNVRSGTSASDSASPPGQPAVLIISPGQHKHLFQLNAAVKALAFAPWQPSLLAAGGGSNDRCIHFFHAASGVKLATIDCYAQVTSLVWNTQRREVAATFGFAQPEHRVRVAVFGWPGSTSDASIKFHEVWDDKPVRGEGTLGGSQILEGTLGMESVAAIR